MRSLALSWQRYVFVLFVFATSACLPVSDQPVSGPITIGQEWLELTPPEPLKVKKNDQSLRFTILGVDDLTADNILVTKDGRRIIIDAVLTDDQGDTYALELGSLSATRYASYYRADAFPPGPDFPVERTLVKIRVRSNVPVEVDEILWFCSL